MADDVLLRILLDKVAQQGVERGLDSFAKKMGELDDVTFDNLEREYQKIIDKANEINEKFREQKQRIAELNRVAGDVSRIGTVLAAAGASVIGAYTLSAKNYVDFIEKAGIKNDEVADRWIAAQNKIKNSQLAIGEATATALLPYLEKAAELIERVAQAAQQNPEAVKAILGAGIGLSIFGALTAAVGKGIKIYADYLYIAALAEHSNSMKGFVAAVTGSKLSGGAVGAAGGALGKVGNVLTIATLAVGEIVLATTATNAVLDYLGAPRLQEMAKAQLDFFKQIPKVLSGDIKLNDLAAQVVNQAQATADARKETEKASGSLRDYTKEAEEAAAAADAAAAAQQRQTAALKTLANIASQQRAADAKYSADLAAAYSSASTQTSKADQQLKDNLAKIDQDLSKSLAKLATDFAKQSTKAEQDYQEQRQKTIRDANENIRKIREDALERLRELEQDHTDRVDELTRARDALGLVKEQRAYERQQAEVRQNEQKQVAEVRRQTQIQLAEQRRAFIEQQQERRAEYEERVKEEKAQAEQRRKEAEAEHEQQLREISSQLSERLAEIRRAYYEERRERILQAQQAIQELSGLLNTERLTKLQYYQAMLGDAKSFIQSYANALRTGSTSGTISATSISGSTGTNQTTSSSGRTVYGPYSLYPQLYPSRQAGGYGPGFVERGDEFVLNPATTRAAEQLVGARLSQRGLIGALRGGVVWNDQRRFYAGVSPEERRVISEDTMEILAEALGA